MSGPLMSAGPTDTGVPLIAITTGIFLAHFRISNMYSHGPAFLDIDLRRWNSSITTHEGNRPDMYASVVMEIH